MVSCDIRLDDLHQLVIFESDSGQAFSEPTSGCAAAVVSSYSHEQIAICLIPTSRESLQFYRGRQRCHGQLAFVMAE